MSSLPRRRSSPLRPVSLPFSLRSLLPLLAALVLILSCSLPAPAAGQTCNGNSCPPDQGSLPPAPPNACDLCTANSTSAHCATAYHNLPATSCGTATLTDPAGHIALRRTQCCPVAYDGEERFLCRSEQHSEEGGVVDGWSCVKVGALGRVLRVGMLVGGVVALFLVAAIGVCVWRNCVKVPNQRPALPQYQQPLVASVPPQLQSSYQPPQPVVAPYQAPAMQAPPLSEHRPQHDQPSEHSNEQL